MPRQELMRAIETLLIPHMHEIAFPPISGRDRNCLNNALLYGSSVCELDVNVNLFGAVHRSILDTKLFDMN